MKKQTPLQDLHTKLEKLEKILSKYKPGEALSNKDETFFQEVMLLYKNIKDKINQKIGTTELLTAEEQHWYDQYVENMRGK